jgi:hypothetical protein
MLTVAKANHPLWLERLILSKKQVNLYGEKQQRNFLVKPKHIITTTHRKRIGR